MVSQARLATSDEGRFIAGRYRVEALIGRGGMGAVYAVTDTTRNVRVALKCTISSAKPKVLELFKREFHTLHGLRHPNIVEVYDYGVDDGQAFYTMELLEGRDLGHAAPLPWREVCSSVRQVATVLGLLHARRLLHRDVTPRNLWVQPDGRIKLLDFGALCPFGVPTEVIGTPPFLAPEWLYDRAAAVSVDQRADLYALGALAYFLLTSAHAYPARSVSDLARVWLRAPAPPSSFVELIEGRALEPIPLELDALVAALLQRDPAARPATTEALIDRIDAIAGAPAVATDPHAVHGWVRSKAFVGRTAERALVEQYLRFDPHAAHAVTIEAGPGLGRSRLLEELAVVGRLAGATSMLVRGTTRDRAFGLANALALGLLEQVPHEVARTAAPYAALLASMSPELSARLGITSASALDLTKRGRAALQQALTDWVLRLSEERPLLVLADDLERADEESSAWLAGLARAADSGKVRLLLVAAMLDEPSARPPLHLAMLREVARVISLAPLTAAEVQALLESVFGPAVYLARVADAVYRASKGSPAHCLELIEHLIERGLARYSEGAWLLPGQLSESELPRSRNTMHLLRLERLGTQARALVELLSVHDGLLTRAQCVAVSESDARDTGASLVELTLGGVLSESEQGYVFAHADVRDAVSSALGSNSREHAHERLATAVLGSAGDPIDALEAGLHFFRAGDVRRCEQLVHDAVRHLFAGHRERMALAVPRLEQVVACYQAAGYGPERLAVPLAALATASFFVDRRLADRYGCAALDALEQLLYFDRIPGWARIIGAKPAFYAALGRAGAKLLRPPPGVPTATEALRMLVGAAVALNAVAVSGLDLAMTARCRAALEPIAVLPEREIAAFTRRCTLAVAAILSEQPAATLRELRALAKILESDEPIRHLPDHLRREYLGGCLLSIGAMEAWRSSRAALEIADRIEPISPMYALDAEHLRALYYAGRGETARADLHRHQVETRALQVGAAWQIVTLGPIDAHITSFWTHDAQLAKRAAAELERLSAELPSLRVEARRARATYLVLGGRYREAIESMRDDDSPSSLAGWSRTQGVLARAHNRLGEHARARDLCRSALEGRSEEDLSFHLMTLHVQLELSNAEAALGDGGAALARIADLLERCASSAGPLALGAMHEMRARIALRARDCDAAREAIEAMRRCYVPTQIGSLLELCHQLGDQLARTERGQGVAIADPIASDSNDDAHMVTRIRLILTHSDAELQGRVARALALVLDATRASDGFVIARGDGAGLIMSEHEPPEPLVRWAEAKLDASGQAETALLDQTVSESAQFCVGTRRYCALLLHANAEQAEGVLVLGFEGRPPRTPSQEVLDLLARQLHGTRAS